MHDVHLFLAHADDHQAVLPTGVPLERMFDAPTPEPFDLTKKRIINLDGSPDALSTQQWAIVAPTGSIGDRLLSLVEPLQKKREEEQGRAALVYRVEPNMDSVAAMHWIQSKFREVVNFDESKRPRYLALLGGPDLISWDFQQMLAGEAFVGRIAFDADAHYAAYVDKLVRVSDQIELPRTKALFHSVLDGSRATQEGDKHLVLPSLEWARAAQKDKSFDADDILNVPMSTVGSPLDPTTAAGALLRESARTRAGFLFTMSHGAGVPTRGWTSPEEQRELQGAMVLGRKGDLLTASDIASTPFLPHGVWFMFACYGAGTPARSAYYPWLARLHELGFLGRAPEHVLAAMPKATDKPFVAALPMAALANPDGPLGFVGHVDLAWSWSFLDYEVDSTGIVIKNRADRFQSVLRAFANGHRLGVAHHALIEFFKSVNGQLTAAYDEAAQRSAGKPDFVEDRATQIRRANLWMQRQDLSAYVLLGDPAARLPISRCSAGIGVLPAKPMEIVDTEAVTDRVDAVLAILRGTTSISATAKRMNVANDEVARWMEVFVEGGRAALARGS